MVAKSDHPLRATLSTRRATQKERDLDPPETDSAARKPRWRSRVPDLRASSVARFLVNIGSFLLVLKSLLKNILNVV